MALFDILVLSINRTGFEQLLLFCTLKQHLVTNCILCKLQQICIKLILLLSYSILKATAAIYLISPFETLALVNHSIPLSYYCTHLLKSTNIISMKVPRKQCIATISKGMNNINCHNRLAKE